MSNFTGAADEHKQEYYGNTVVGKNIDEKRGFLQNLFLPFDHFGGISQNLFLQLAPIGKNSRKLILRNWGNWIKVLSGLGKPWGGFSQIEGLKVFNHFARTKDKVC